MNLEKGISELAMSVAIFIKSAKDQHDDEVVSNILRLKEVLKDMRDAFENELPNAYDVLGVESAADYLAFFSRFIRSFDAAYENGLGELSGSLSFPTEGREVLDMFDSVFHSALLSLPFIAEDMQAPLFIVRQAELRANAKWDALKPVLEEQGEPDELLKACEATFFTGHITIKTSLPTIRFLRLRDTMLEHLQYKVFPYVSQSKFSSLQQYLLHNNINHLDIFLAFTSLIRKELESALSIEMTIDLLREYRKDLRQMYVSESAGLHLKLPALKEQIASWLEEELSFQCAKVQLSNQVQTSTTIATNEKVQMSLSVAELGYFVRILHQCKVITNRNQSEFIRVVAGNFQTLKTASISYDSLYGKYFKPESATIRSIKDLLLTMVGEINRSRD
jgi:hypothetical protein